MFWGKYRECRRRFCSTSVLGIPTFALKEIFKIIHHIRFLVWVLSESGRNSRVSLLTIKPWPKLKTWVYLRLRLVRACVHLRWLAMTCAHFGRDQICTQVKASFSPFGLPTQVNASWVTSINLLLANEIQDMSALKWVFLRLACTCEKTCEPFGHPTYASSTCAHLRLLAGPFDQGFMPHKPGLDTRW